MAIPDFDGRHAIDFLDQLVKEGLSEASANRYAASLSSVFGYAVKLKLIASKPHIPFFDEPEGRIRTYTRNQIHQFIEYFEGRGEQWMADIIRVAANSGMRKGEIVKVGDPDPVHGAHLNREAKAIPSSSVRMVSHAPCHSMTKPLRHYADWKMASFTNTPIASSTKKDGAF